MAIRGFHAHIYFDPPELERAQAFAEAARARVEGFFTWQRKAEQVVGVYDWVTHRAASKPDFFGIS